MGKIPLSNMPEVRKKCGGCGHSWLDKYGKDECPKCLCSLSGGGKDKGGNCGNGQSAGSAMESQSGACPKNDSGPHTWKFGKCSHCGCGEGGANKTKFGECRKGGKHIYKFAKCSKCGCCEGGVSAAPAGNVTRSKQPKKKIANEEYDIHNQDFAKFDKDGSGLLDPAEIKALLTHQLGREASDSAVKGFIDEADKDKDGKISLPEYIASMMGADWEAVPSNRKNCPTCGHKWLDAHGKDECPKCLAPLSGGKARGGNCGNGQSAGSAMESSSGDCSKGGAHTWKFGKCSKCGAGEGGAGAVKFGECDKGGKHIYKFSKCTKCGHNEF